MWQKIKVNFDANIPQEEKKDDYRILLTSDVLAEGVNLHRSNVVVNYDSPWNASRLMQRNGRVNRIGSRAENIYNYMFYPSRQGDEEIQLYKNALIKMQGFQSALGEDSKVYSHEEIVKEFQLFNADVQDDTDRTLALLEEARVLFNTDKKLYEKIKAMPAKSRTIRNSANVEAASASPKSSVVFLTSPRKTDYYLVHDNQAQSISFLDATDILRAKPDEQPLRLEDALDIHYDQVHLAQEAFESAVTSVEDTNIVHASRPVSPHSSEALKILKEAKVLAVEKENADMVDMCNVLIDYVKQGTFNEIEDRLRRTSRQSKNLAVAERHVMIAQAIAELYDIYYMDITESSPIEAENQEFGNVGLIVSETII